jgi:DNA-binding SARP family transcriptional activator
MVHIYLLGGFRLQSGDELITTLTVPRLQSLLAYFVLHRENPQLRQHLAFLFWPDSTEAQARTNLRRALHDLRLALPDAERYLNIQTQWIQWLPGAPFTLDVSQFEALLAQAEQLVQNRQSEQAVTAFERAVEFYRGPLLPGCYDDWVLAKREELDQRFGAALDHLIDLLESQRDYEAAIAYAQRRLRHDPLQESSYQRLMRLHALHGDRASALRVFHECAAMFARELGVEPSAETRAAHAQLLNPEATATLPAEQPLRTADTTELVGRQPEWQQLLLAWQHACQGHAHVISLTGEAGIGKTRLAETLYTWVRRQGLRAASARAYEAEGALAFAPLIDLLRSDTLAPELFQLSEVWLAHIARLLPELLDQHPKLARTQPGSDPLQRPQFYEALARGVLGSQEGAPRPLLLVLDDLQWCDRETVEWLRYLLRYAPQARLLVVVTVRTAEAAADHPLHALLLSLRRDHRLTEIALSRLTRNETATLAAQLAGRALTADQVAALYQHTEGNPFFVVEIVRADVAHWAAGGERAPNAAGSAALRRLWSPSGSLPDRVLAVIESRLAQLAPLAQEVARLAAVIGRSFSLDVLAHAGGYSEDDLVRSLDELWQRHILREQGAAEYDFSHPLFRDVAYAQISPLRRRMLHRRAAQALEIVYQPELDAVSGLVAIHYELGGSAEQAIHVYQRAARFAKQAYAYWEAAAHLRSALALLSMLPDDDARRQQELELQLELGFVLMMAKGWADQEARQAYDRALALCHGAGTGVERFDASWGLHEIYLFQANGAKALDASQICWELAQQAGDPELLLQAHHAFWGTYFWFYIGPKGLQGTVDHAQQGFALYRPEWHRTHVLRYGGHDPGVCALSLLARAQWLLGYPDQAVAASQSGVTLAAQLDHPFTFVNASLVAATIHVCRGEPGPALTLLDQAKSMILRQEMRMLIPHELAWRGAALGQLAPSTEAASLLRQGISLCQAMGVRLEQPAWLAILAETYERMGDMELARQAIEEGLAMASDTGEDFYRPELYRLHGRCWLAAGDVDAAQASFRQALDIAQQQRARSLELRAATDLSRLMAAQGSRAQAYTLLSGIYGWFREGFDTADLRAAQALLHSLAPT